MIKTLLTILALLLAGHAVAYFIGLFLLGIF